MSSIKHLAFQVEDDLTELCPFLYKNPREKLALLVATAIETGSCNTMELAGRLPLETERSESRYAWVERLLSTKTIDDSAVMAPLAEQIIGFVSSSDDTMVLCIDQTSIGDSHGIAMLSLRVGSRGVPLFWYVEATKGPIPTKAYLALLEKVVLLIPSDTKVILAADRFFDASMLITKCREYGWGWRIRLRSDRVAGHEDSELKLSEMPGLALKALVKARLGKAETNIGYLHEKGHDEAWYIAMDAIPTKTTILDYGLRWSCEAMFSDLKTRGFRLEDTQLQRTDRISRLILVLSIAMHWAVINGWNQQKKLKKQVQ